MIYFLQRADGAIKIGVTENYESRIYSLSLRYGNLELLGVMQGSYSEEKSLHLQFCELKIEGEWFRECEQLQSYIAQNAQDAQFEQILSQQTQHISRRERGNTEPEKPRMVKTRFPSLIAKKQLEMNIRFTQAEIAEQLGISPATISRWIRGRVDRFDADTIEKLCTYFRCEIGDLLYLDWESTD
ncbi:MAG: helix-turn-helix transcriptional regulator [Burkholderiales bacterium]|nr:helix-turn-helix transcriptional regulator [Anaerolineae bacterium]